MTYRCRRCQFRHDDPTSPDVDTHAWADPGHPRCLLCTKSLPVDAAQCCLTCVASVRRALVQIETNEALLPEAAEDRRYASLPIPGGDAMVMLAGGAPGRVTSGRPTHTPPPTPREYGSGPAGEHVVHPPYVTGNTAPPGREHVADQWASDAPSVLATLAGIEDDWREFFTDPAGPEATVTGCLGYLATHLDRAAQCHPGFDDDARTLRRLATRVTRVTGRNDDPLRANVACFDCGGQLARRYREPVDAVERLRRGKDREGLEDDWGCLSCGGVYDQASYYLALRARLEAEAMVDTMTETEGAG